MGLESALNNPQIFLFSDCSGVIFCNEFWAISLLCYKTSVSNLSKNSTPSLAYFTFSNDSIVTDRETRHKLKYFFKGCSFSQYNVYFQSITEDQMAPNKISKH